tara:strand:- start:27 stop:614 length:588 start_codon:yes stop_codon:yes gene_type:complete
MQRIHKILLIDNFDSFTFLIADAFKQLDCEVQIVRNDISPKNATKDFDLLVLSPGPCSPKESAYLMKYIEHFYLSKPIFGICLGFQAIVSFFNGNLTYTNPIHGESLFIKHDGKSLYKGLDNEISVGRYHSIVTDTLPKCMHASARTKDGLIMSARHNDLPIEGVQFHPESFLSNINESSGYKIFRNAVFHAFVK